MRRRSKPISAALEQAKRRERGKSRNEKREEMEAWARVAASTVIADFEAF